MQVRMAGEQGEHTLRDDLVARITAARAELEQLIGALSERQITTPGHATILLPSREHGPVRLPDPPGGATDLTGALAAIAERFARE